jgi:flagellum-specific peptidoglycan hydrolase FlgJ
MRKIVQFILITSIVFLASCSSTKRTNQISSENKRANVKLEKQEDKIYAQSDAVFMKFKENNLTLNGYTMAYIADYKNIAIEKMMEYKIPASITLAQGILESGNGRSELTRKANNHFGIKCHSDWKGKKVYHDDDKRGECFRKYDNPVGSFNDHSLFLTTRSRYDFLFDLKRDNYKGWAKGLKKAGYATDRKYPTKLINLIEDYKLYEYDDLVIDNKGYQRSTLSDLAAENDDESVHFAPYSGKFIIVTKGDTLYSIARNNSTTVAFLKEINDLTSNEISVGQKLYVTKN